MALTIPYEAREGLSDSRKTVRPRRMIRGNSSEIVVQDGYAIFPFPVVGVRSSSAVSLEILPSDNNVGITANMITGVWPIPGDGQIRFDCSFIALKISGSTGYNAATVEYYFEGSRG